MNKLVIFAQLMIGQLLCAFALSLLSPFFPPFAEEKGISPFYIGVIFSANPIGAILASLILGKVLTDNNKYVFMCTGLLFQSIGLYLFGITYYEDRIQIIITGMIARFINGFGTAAFMTPLYAYIPMLFPDSVEQKVSIAEICLSMGFLIAPVVGSSLYSLGGYNLPFLFFGTFALVLVPVMAYSFREIYNSTNQQIQPIEYDEDNEKQIKESLVKEDMQKLAISKQSSSRTFNQSPNKLIKQESFQSVEHPSLLRYGSMTKQIIDLNLRLTQLNEKDYNKSLLMAPLNYSEVLCSYPVCMTALCGFCVTLMFNFLGPINANYLVDQYNLSEDNIGYCLSGAAVFYSIGAFTAGRIKNNQTFFMFLGGLVLGITAIFTGPDTEIVKVDKNLYITLLGLSVMGGAAPFLIIFNVPLLNALLNKRFPSRPIQCANMSAALFTSGAYIGELFGPISAGLLTDAYGYPRAVTCMGCVVILFSILYIPVMIQKVEVEVSQELLVDQLKDNDSVLKI